MPQTVDENDVVRAILSRRSIRTGFDGRMPPDEVLEAIVGCGLAAPSSKNARPWRLHVVTARRILDAIASAADDATGTEDYVPHDPLTGRPFPEWESTVRESASVLRAAPCGIVIENRGVFSRGVSTLSRVSAAARESSLTAFGLESIGVGAALENMWLAANSLGLSAAFLGDLAIAEGAVRELLAVEGDVVGVLALGYSAAVPPPRREPPASTQTASPVAWYR